ncbi:MAG: DNA adenine methylase [Planctomycetota bacterium]
MIKYLGSKRLLIPAIRALVAAVPHARRVCDPFSGTARVGHALKRDGFAVAANDVNLFATTLARCWVEADLERHGEDAAALLDELAHVQPEAGWFTDTFCVQSRYFRPENGARIEAIRNAIARKALDPVLESVLLTALLQAADRVDSTCGLQMAYLKQWAPRAHTPLELRVPELAPAARHGPCEAHCGEAEDFVAAHAADVIYLDPPYNQHSYLGNYHVWETLVRWDAPECYGVARKRADCKQRRSEFNSRRRCGDALARVIARCDARVLIVSFNDEGHLTRDEITALLATRGPVHVHEIDYKRYVGAQIGIYNPSGERVGAVSHLRNKELLFVVDVAGTGVRWDEVLAAACAGLALTSASAATRSGRATRSGTGRASPRPASQADSHP